MIKRFYNLILRRYLQLITNEDLYVELPKYRGCMEYSENAYRMYRIIHHAQRHPEDEMVLLQAIPHYLSKGCEVEVSS